MLPGHYLASAEKPCPPSNKGKMLKLYELNACSMPKAIKNLASKKAYVSHRQLTFVNFDSPFTRHLPKMTFRKVFERC